jgi:predicted DNA-binding WGR domain protein
MNRIYLERHEPDKNLHRFYQMHIVSGIFGDWSLVREWGRVGSPGTVRKEWFESEEEATAAGKILSKFKRKKGIGSEWKTVRKIKIFRTVFCDHKNKGLRRSRCGRKLKHYYL